MPARQYPTRSCVACRTPRAKRELERVVRSPTGVVGLDPTGRAPGRGAYVCPDPGCREAALKKGALRRALGVPIPVDLFAGPAGANPTDGQQSDEGGA
ncbi:MAG: YlxR family protein [Chloroflexi bacterium]|nr:YlxR family protein [Chloroflexota bacterium]